MGLLGNIKKLMMRLGIHFNAFDGLELLETAINSVRSAADFICVVYQDVSNFGEPMSEQNRKFINDLKISGKADLVYPYVPTSRNGHLNEIKKRNLGKSLCKGQNCTHHMTMDVDEFYLHDQLQFAKAQMSSGAHDASVCKMQTYWKNASYALDPPEEYYVPLIYTMDNRLFDLRNRWSLPADPTRRLPSNRIRVFERSEIEMHHFSYVRSDIGSKLRNSSANVNFNKRIDALVGYYNSWQPGQPAYLAGLEERYHNLRNVEPLFDIPNVNS